MLPNGVAEANLLAHLRGEPSILVYEGIRVDVQHNYEGLMAKGAYRQYKHEWNKGRRKVGCFDFKIFDVSSSEPVPLVHTRTLGDAFSSADPELVEAVFMGKDPESLSNEAVATKALCEIQLAMLEQEVNWGDEFFQSKTYFLPSKGLRARDFIMAYLRRGYAEPGLL